MLKIQKNIIFIT